MELPPSNNPLGGPVFPNGPIGNMFEPNDAHWPARLASRRENTLPSA